MHHLTSKSGLAVAVLGVSLVFLAPRGMGQERPNRLFPFLELANKPAMEPDKKFREVNHTFKESLAILFRARIFELREMDFFRDVIDQLAKSDKFDFNPSLLKKFDLDNPSTRDMLRRWRIKSRGKLDQESINSLKELLQPQSPEFGVKFMTGIGPLGMPMGSGLSLTNLPSPGQAPQKMPRWMRDFLRSAEGSRLGEYLRKSPSWNSNVAQLRGVLNFDQTQAAWQGLAEKWQLDSLKIPGAQGLLNRISTLSLPDWNRSISRMPALSLPGIDAPALSLPTAPGMEGWQGAQTYLWPILLFILGICAWRFFRNPGRTSAAARRADLGPWPIDVALIASRSDLIKAFEYLALLRLGADAKTWNHRLIAAQWTKSQPADAALGDAAGRLAALYEWARYTEGDAPLNRDAQRSARQALEWFAHAPA